MTSIKGYNATTDWKPSPNGKYIFAEKDSVEYFIKEFLSPVYPLEGSCSPKVMERRKAQCKQFEMHQNGILKKLRSLAGTGGNLVVWVDFFREKQRYYKITRKIDTSTIGLESISRMPFEQQLLLLKTVSHSLRTLHKAKIVHGDLKPENVLITRSETGSFTTKIIDFDSSYFEGCPPDSEDTIGTVNYYSPELATHVIDADNPENAKHVTCKSDIFALGLLFHEYLTGEKPLFNGYKYAYEALLDGKLLIVSKKIRSDISYLIDKMLNGDYKKRPGISEVFEELKAIDPEIKPVEIKPPDVKTTPSVSRILDGVILLPPVSYPDGVTSVQKLNNGQYRISYNDGKSRILPEHYIKSKGYDKFVKG